MVEMKVHLVCLLFCAVSSSIFGQSQLCGDQGELRLVQTPNISNYANNAGRLEVCVGGVWGTIASSLDSVATPWSEKNAQVACRQLGFSGALNSIFQNTTSVEDRPADGGPVPIHYSRVICDGTERELSNCTLQANENEIFSHRFDIFIVCRPTRDIESQYYTDLHPPGPDIGDIRLLGSPINGYGAVEIYTSIFRWTGICPDSDWTDSNAEIICQQLGYETGVTETFEISNGAIRQRAVTNAECSGDLEFRSGSISAGVCLFSSGSCASRQGSYAGVVCNTTSLPKSVRISGGQSSGVVEVLFDGRWGVICDESFFSREAGTVCAQLGFDRNNAKRMDVSRTTLREEESNLKPLWLNNLDCPSSADDISMCTHDPIVGFADCFLPEIAAVDCDAGGRGGLSSGAVIGILAFVFISIIILGAVLYFSADHWKKCCDTLREPSEWNCNCDCNCDYDLNFVAARRRRERRIREMRRRDLAEALRQVQPENFAPTTAPTTMRQDSSSSSRDPEATVVSAEPTEPQEPGFTKAPPPSYSAASNFPEHDPDADLPPPYPGGPATSNLPSDSPASQLYPPQAEQAYPPPTNPGYPINQPAYDPAFPPPSEYPASVINEPGVPLPYPTDTLPFLEPTADIVG